MKPIALPDHVRERLIAAEAVEAPRRAVFANLSDGDLVASAKFWMANCAAPKRWIPGDPVYDATFWHIIVPEMLRRLSSATSTRRT